MNKFERSVMEQALTALDRSDKISGHATNRNTVNSLRKALEASTKPCTCCGDGTSWLSVTRVCDSCGSEYASQAEFDTAKRMELEQQSEPVAVIGPAFQLLYARWDWSGGLKVGDKLYTHPQKQLSDEEIRKLIVPGDYLTAEGLLKFARSVLAAAYPTSPVSELKPLTEAQIEELRLETGYTHGMAKRTAIREFTAIVRAIENKVRGET